MKRMKSKIALTFAIIFVVCFIVNGLYSVIFLGEDFFSFGAMRNGMIVALWYFMYIWIQTRRHRMLAMISVTGITFMILFAVSPEGVVNLFRSWTLEYTVMAIEYVVVYSIAEYQVATSLLEESKE